MSQFDTALVKRIPKIRTMASAMSSGKIDRAELESLGMELFWKCYEKGHRGKDLTAYFAMSFRNRTISKFRRLKKMVAETDAFDPDVLSREPAVVDVESDPYGNYHAEPAGFGLSESIDSLCEYLPPSSRDVISEMLRPSPQERRPKVPIYLAFYFDEEDYENELPFARKTLRVPLQVVPKIEAFLRAMYPEEDFPLLDFDFDTRDIRRAKANRKGSKLPEWITSKRGHRKPLWEAAWRCGYTPRQARKILTRLDYMVNWAIESDIADFDPIRDRLSIV